ncbi:flagellar type III secretion system pore protein FliP [Enterobacter sp. K16B]|nr:flagellar type III secretion system pore protein FliP [Enterobacter sp. K16B]MCA2028489.1 flagellar type III secretion system pore protein FliP [Enterobacter sp. K16B]
MAANGDITLGQPSGEGGWTLPVQTLLLLSGFTFIPAVLLMMTGFTRIIIVLGLLRNALGTPTAPPNQVLVGLSLFLTFFVMSPVFSQIYEKAWQPLQENKITMEVALTEGVKPLRAFMLDQTRESDLAMFARIAKTPDVATPQEVPLSILIPAFITSELKTAFQIGFTIFIPFLIIDLVVASILMALGMMMVPPTTIALPFKLMLFVLVDGWQLLVGSLAQSFYS